ncbi:MAG: ferrous iron transport protein B [Clostridia bacterium]|nr:ferrous iron transport protein B [Clostridia bacterium]
MSDNITVALAGNPNVGKSTIFNALTGMKQHTGNWAGKTVDNAVGYYKSQKFCYTFVDIPGTYSLMAHSPEEEIARNFLCFQNPDAVVVVCDATCLERNLNLVLQTMEICKNVIVCVNLIDQAKAKKITVNLEMLQKKLGVAVVGTVGHKKKSILSLIDTLDQNTQNKNYLKIKYPKPLETALDILEPKIKEHTNNNINPRWLSLKLLEEDVTLQKQIESFLGKGFLENEDIKSALKEAKTLLQTNGITKEDLEESIVNTIIKEAESITSSVIEKSPKSHSLDRKLDSIFTSRLLGFPIMLLFLGLIFWITISLANYPSELLSRFFTFLETKLSEGMTYLGAPEWLHNCLILGVFRTLSWVVSVMLPPMAIFFPLFTLLEDSGYLPRIAFNLDKPFKSCNACGKQALTMCMGFGCNAVGVTGCRIIDSKRERLLAILTNNLVPCNGRFPTIIAIITMFLCFGNHQSLLSALMLLAVIVLGVIATFILTKFLSVTVLKGTPSSYTLELPPYRKPQITKVIVRSIFDRTLFVLGRAVSVAAPAGLFIWLMANIFVNDASLLTHCASFLDPFGKLLGLDGVILLAFILGLPANEIVMPIIIMAYLNNGFLTESSSLFAMRELFVANGWTINTAISVILFSLFHWPCATSILTIKKETGSIKWTAVAVLLPTVLSILVCMVFNFVIKLF